MSDAEMTPAQQAWERFADELKRVGKKVVGPTGATTDRERAEGFRYLARLIGAGQELAMEADRQHPVLARMMTPIRSFIADGTDTLYHEAKLDETLEYVLEVTRGDDLFFSAVVYAQDEDDMNYMVGHLIDEDIVFDDIDGRSTARIHLAATRPESAKNWIELGGKKPFVLTRQYFPEFVTAVDAGKYRQATMTIAPTVAQPAPEEFTADALSEGLERLVAFMDDSIESALGISAFVALNMIAYERDDTTPTRIGADGQLILDGSHDTYSADELADMVDPKIVANNLPGPGIGYIGAMYTLADDEAILIEGTKVPCRYWSCQILTRFLESCDYRHHRVAINDREVDFDEDGSFRIYASASDPGVRNWVATEGYRRGQIVVRSLLAEEDFEPELSVIKISDIPERDRR
jgi:hypothetical protein